MNYRIIPLMQKPSAKPIGVFDSGLGGLSVVAELTKILPHEDIVYLGDTARVPYGPRSARTIREFSQENTRFLLSKKVKAVVIACNTSSAVAASFLIKSFKNIPIFEVIKPASRESVKTGKRIGVIGTHATIGSKAYQKSIHKYSKDVKVYGKACPLFVPFIEEGELESDALRIISAEYLSVFKTKNIDTLIMGCTHYPIIENVIQKALGGNVKLINPGKSVADEVAAFLEKGNLLNEQKRLGKVDYFVTDLTDRFTKVAEMFLGKKIGKSLRKTDI